jgi:hypothetical protein
MFTWLRNKLEARRRSIFHYWNGSRWRRVDPADINRKMRDHPTFVFEKHVPLLREQDTFGQEAYDITYKAMLDIFDVHPVNDQGGLTETEVMWLLTSYCEFCLALKKNISFRPILLPTMESIASDGESILTRPSSDSLSSAPDLPLAAPTL